MKVPPFPIAPGTELRLREQLQVVQSIDDNGQVTLMCPLRKTTLNFELSELVSMRMAGTLKPIHVGPEDHPPSGEPTYASMSDESRQRTLRRVAYGRKASELYPIGPKSAKLKELIAEVAERIGDPGPPSPHSVYRWVRRFVGSGYDTAVFMQDGAVRRTRKPRKIPDKVRTRLGEHIQTLLGRYPGAKINGITDLALALTARDSGHATFITKERVEELVDPFVNTAEAVLAQRPKYRGSCTCSTS